VALVGEGYRGCGEHSSQRGGGIPRPFVPQSAAEIAVERDLDARLLSRLYSLNGRATACGPDRWRHPGNMQPRRVAQNVGPGERGVAMTRECGVRAVVQHLGRTSHRPRRHEVQAHAAWPENDRRNLDATSAKLV